MRTAVRRVSMAVAGLVALFVIAVVASASSTGGDGRRVPVSVARLAAGFPSPPAVLTARRLRPRGRPWTLERSGTVVRASDLSDVRAFANARIGFALATGPNAEYPALTTDGGRVWRIDGPQFHVDAADGPEGVGFVGVAGPRTFFAYGSSAVDVTTDGGRSWWETLLGEQVMAVAPNGYREDLVAYVDESVSGDHLNPAVTWQYVSRDGGRQWRYSTAFAGLAGNERSPPRRG